MFPPNRSISSFFFFSTNFLIASIYDDPLFSFNSTTQKNGFFGLTCLKGTISMLMNLWAIICKRRICFSSSGITLLLFIYLDLYSQSIYEFNELEKLCSFLLLWFSVIFEWNYDHAKVLSTLDDSIFMGCYGFRVYKVKNAFTLPRICLCWFWICDSTPGTSIWLLLVNFFFLYHFPLQFVEAILEVRASPQVCVVVHMHVMWCEWSWLSHDCLPSNTVD